MHIGLIAVSGVRIYDQRLLELGLTLPGFVERANVIASMPSLGLLAAAGGVPARHRLTYLEMPELDLAALDRHDFDVVALSSFTAKAPVMYAIADACRARGTKVILGGLHATLVPVEAALHADAVVIGSGERTFPQAIQDLEDGRLAPIYRSGARGDELADAPLPRYDLLESGRYNRMPVQTTRGCPRVCEFCGASRVFSAYQKKPIPLVVRDLRTAKALAGHPFVELADDNTFVDKAWSRQLVQAIAREDVRWFTETDLSVADDPELLDLLADSGCRQLLVGLESPTQDALVHLDRGHWKLRGFDRAIDAIEAIQRRGISVNGCFILGLDGHGPEVFDEVERFVARSGLTEVQITVQTAFPGTALYRRLGAEGRLLYPGQWERCTLFDVAFVPKKMTVSDLEQGLATLMSRLYTDVERSRRRRLHAHNVRTARSERRRSSLPPAA